MAPIIEHPIMDNSQVPKILFSSKSKNYGFLSNSYYSEITIDNKTYNHVEGYYQSRKHYDINQRAAEHIRNIMSPMACRKVSKGYYISDEKKKQWNEKTRDVVMRQAVYTKFITNSELSRKLIETKDAELIENDPENTYWGGGKDGKGQNKLGKILMEVRTIIINCAA